MPNEQRKQLDQSHPDEKAGELTSARHAIEDLSPSERRSDDVRGGALPPDGFRASVLSPDGKTVVYALPPDE